MNAFGDEFHFIMECPKFEELRTKLLSPIFFPQKISCFFFGGGGFCGLFSARKKVHLGHVKVLSVLSI